MEKTLLASHLIGEDVPESTNLDRPRYGEHLLYTPIRDAATSASSRSPEETSIVDETKRTFSKSGANCPDKEGAKDVKSII